MVVFSPHPDEESIFHHVQRKRQQQLLGHLLLREQQQEEGDENPPSRGHRPSREHRVTFREEPHLATVIDDHPHVMTLLEEEACFFDRGDRWRFERDRVETARRYDACRTTWQETDMQTRRGLEDLLATTAMTKETTRRIHVHAVLRAEARVRHECGYRGDVLHTTLRYVSGGSSADARRRAVALGRADAADVARETAS